MPYSDGRTLAALYDLGAPIAERRDTAEGVRVRARLPRAEAARFARYLVAEDGRELEATVAMIDVAVRRLRPDAHVPRQAYEGDAGLDLSACEGFVVGTARACGRTDRARRRDPRGYAGFVQPRSGLAARHGIGLVNSPGLIDSGYRGEIRVVLLNTGDEPFAVEPGMRIAQLVVVPVAAVRVVEVDELAASERGSRGFGSSAT